MSLQTDTDCVRLYDLHLLSLGRAAGTRHCHGAAVGSLSAYCRGRGLLGADAATVSAWVADLYGRLRRNTVRDYVLAVGGFYRYAVGQSWVKASPIDGIQPPRPQEVSVRPYSDDEVRRLLAVAGNLRDRALLLLLLSTGLRASELVSIKLEDVSWELGLIRVVNGKGNKPRVVAPDDFTLSVLKEYIESPSFGHQPRVNSLDGEQARAAARLKATGKKSLAIARELGIEGAHSRQPKARKYAEETVHRLIQRVREAPYAGPYLWPGPAGRGHYSIGALWARVLRLAAAAGVEGAFVHRFRHTFASSFLKLGGDVGDLQTILGHATITMSLHYARYTAVERSLIAQRKYNPVNALLGQATADTVSAEERIVI